MSAAPERHRHVTTTGSAQAVGGVDSSEEGCKQMPKRRKTDRSDRSGAKPSEFVGVSWITQGRKWRADIQHGGKTQYLGLFVDERDAARAVDTAARRLRGDNAHGGRVGVHWLRLNFPTEGEVKTAKDRGAVLTAEDRATVTTALEPPGPSAFVGVHWNKAHRKWGANIRHDRKQQHLGFFNDERDAARAVDTAARRLRGDNAHGGRVGVRWLRLNFPTEGEAKSAKARRAVLTAEDRAAAAAAGECQGPSEFVGVGWGKRDRKWRAMLSHNGKQQHQGCFDDERDAARAVDTAARRLRGEDAHGGRAGTHWHRLNFPSKREAGRGKALGLPGASSCNMLRSCEL
jgi:hypothetical protein